MKISIALILCLSSSYSYSCTNGDYLNEIENKAASKRFKERWKVGKKEITKYMNNEYGYKNWVIQKERGNWLIHENRPKIKITKYIKSNQYIIMYERIGSVNHWYEEASKIEYFASYKNISSSIKEITLPSPERIMSWSRLHRLWLIQRYTDKMGKTKVLLNELPWEYYVSNCGSGNGVVSH